MPVPLLSASLSATDWQAGPGLVTWTVTLAQQLAIIMTFLGRGRGRSPGRGSVRVTVPLRDSDARAARRGRTRSITSRQ